MSECPGWPKGPCGKPAGTPWTDVWCAECDEKRRERITRRLEALSERREAWKS